ncbi:NAD(P)-binding protein [Poronia punctata]|nr:NAD(P)-binding protein [Poronia punctata]
MPGTTHPEFNEKTEALEVAKAFSDGIKRKTIVVTGGNPNGIGFSTLQAFASQSPAHLIILGRTPAKKKTCNDHQKTQKPPPETPKHPIQIDLSSQKSIRAVAPAITSSFPKIDILINSAGVMGMPERILSEDGIEMHFATNHLGHFLLTCLLMPSLISASSPPARIINVSSMSPTAAGIRWSDINFSTKNRDLPPDEQPTYDWIEAWGYTDVREMSYIGLEAYNQSKVANVLFSVALTNRLYDEYGILSLALHPGAIVTELGRDFEQAVLDAVGKMFEAGVYSYKTLGQGAATSLVAALDPKLGKGVVKGELENYGVFLVDCQPNDQVLPKASSNENAERLWKLSEELVKEEFKW